MTALGAIDQAFNHDLLHRADRHRGLAALGEYVRAVFRQSQNENINLARFALDLYGKYLLNRLRSAALICLGRSRIEPASR
jgi:hypothetical protein